MVKEYLSIGEVAEYLNKNNYLDLTLNESLRMDRTIQLMLDLINERKISIFFHYIGTIFKINYTYAAESQLFNSRKLLNKKENIDFYNNYLRILDLRDVNWLLKGEKEKVTINELVRVIPIGIETEVDVDYEIEEQYYLTINDIRFYYDELENIFKKGKHEPALGELYLQLQNRNEQLSLELLKANNYIKSLKNQQSDQNALADNKVKANQKKPLLNLLYALIKEQRLTLTEKGQGNANDILLSLTQQYNVPVDKGFIKNWLMQLYELEQKLLTNSKK